MGNYHVSDPNIIANHFTSFFTNIGKNLANKIPQSEIDPVSYCGRSNDHSIVIETFSETEVINIIKS